MTEKLNIHSVAPQLIPVKWAEYKAVLQRACEQDIERKITVESLYESIMSNKSFLIEINMDSRLLGVAVCSRSSKAQALFIQACAGTDVDVWLDELVDYLNYMASGLGCTDGLLFCGRIGWQKKLARLGFKSVLVTMHKERENVSRRR